MSSSSPPTKTAALTVPILPHTSPQAAQPPLKLPLHPHQLRALHRCLLIEQDGSLSQDFGDMWGYKSKGGVLADAVGTGKTATSIGLVLSSLQDEPGDTLVVAPCHLIAQWKHEIHKFADESVIEVLVGQQEYDRKGKRPPPPNKRRIVLVDVNTILNESSKLWYNFRRVFASEKGPQLRNVSKEKMERYRQAALACVKSPSGPCSYDGWVYTSSFHMPRRPWRRVIFDEIQDLVQEGRESQKNLLQLSREAPHVWLLSATPFPHGNSSVYANHELLGFCRLKLDVEVSHKLSEYHTFEKIKRKLYIKSPPHVADEAVVARKSVVHKTEFIDQIEVEKRFYQMEMSRIQDVAGSDEFGESYAPLREMTVHPEASAELRQLASGSEKDRGVGQFSSLSSFASVSLNRAKLRRKELNGLIKKATNQVTATEMSLQLARKVKQVRQEAIMVNPFEQATDGQDNASDREANAIHSHFCSCPSLGSANCVANKRARFRTTVSEDYAGPEFIQGFRATEQIIDFFNTFCGPTRTVGNGSTSALDHYIGFTTVAMSSKRTDLEALRKELDIVKTRIEVLPGATSKARDATDQQDLLTSTHGSKPAALVRYLRNVLEKGEKAIVFSYWHDTLKLVHRTLIKCGLASAFCDGNGFQMSRAIQDFTESKKSILLLSALAKASGANLQCATHVVLLDPAGSSAEHGAALEQQAVGRAVRMGQTQPVTVVRFCVRSTIEESLFDQISEAAQRARERANDLQYVCEGAHKSLPTQPPKQEAGKHDTVEVTQSLSAKERSERKFEEAQKNGMVVVLDDSDDEKDIAVDEPSERVQTKSKQVKKENAKRARENEEDKSKSKRTCTTTGTALPSQSTLLSRSTPPITPEPSKETASATGSRKEKVPVVSQSFEEQTEGKSGIVAVKEFLERCNLLEYFCMFKTKGYDSLEWLQEASNDLEMMEKVASDVGFKVGHAMRFQHLLSKEKPSLLPSEKKVEISSV